jgi:hypothetical protein
MRVVLAIVIALFVVICLCGIGAGSYFYLSSTTPVSPVGPGASPTAPR